MTSRRTFLKGVSACGGAALLIPATGAGAAASAKPAFIIDGRFPDGADLARRARATGHPVYEPGGEMIVLLLDNAEDLLGRRRTIIGLTGYADLALARDFLRMHARPIHHTIALPDVGDRNDHVTRSTVAAGLLASLAPLATASRTSRASSFLWLA